MRLSITHCPTCGSDQVQQKCRDWTSTFQGKSYAVLALTLYAYPVCGERVFERKAVAKMRFYSPAYARKPARAWTVKASQSEALTQAASVV